MLTRLAAAMTALLFLASPAGAQGTKDAGAERIRALITSLGDSDARVQGAAITALGESGSRDAVGPLIKLSDDPDPNIRRLVLEALVAIGDKRALDVFLNALEDSDGYIRKLGIQGLVKLGDKRAGPAMVKNLDDYGYSGSRASTSEDVQKMGDACVPALGQMLRENMRLRRVATNILMNIGTKAAMAELEVSAKDPRWPVRLAVIEMAGGRLPVAADGPLAAALRDPSPAVRLAATRVLAGRFERDREPCIPLLIAAAKDEHPLVRSAAVRGLGVDASRVVAPICELLGDRSPVVRGAAAEALSHVYDGAALAKHLKALEAALDDRSPGIRASAVGAIAKVPDKKTIPLLARALKENPGTEIVGVAARGLGRFQDDEAVEGLVPALKDAPYRMDVVRILGEMKTPRAIQALREAFHDQDAQFRVSVLGALKAANDKTSAYVFRAALLDGDPYVRRTAVWELAEVAGQDAVADIAKALKDKDPEVRKTAAGTLSRFKGKEVVSALASALDDGDRGVFTAVVDSLVQVGGSEAVEPLCVAMKSITKPGIASTDRFHTRVIQALGKARDERAVPALADLLKERSEATDYEVTAALGRIGGDSAVDALAKAAQGDPEKPRYNAIRALGATRSRRAAGPLLTLAKHKDLAARRMAGEALVKVAPDKALDAYLAALESRGESSKDLALAVRKTGKKDPVEGLISLLDVEGSNLREYVTRVLGQIGDKRAIPPLERLAKGGDRSLAQEAQSALAVIRTQASD